MSLFDIYFIFDKQLYKQVNGLDMGQPVTPKLTNIFLRFNETKWLHKCPPEFTSELYRRYIDYKTFLLFRDVRQTDLFLDFLNTHYKWDQFTKEVEIKNSLSFLNVSITKDDNEFTT